jgi:hypothetical protein
VTVPEMTVTKVDQSIVTGGSYSCKFNLQLSKLFFVCLFIVKYVFAGGVIARNIETYYVIVNSVINGYFPLQRTL